MSEDPPGDRDHPDDDEDHNEYVVHYAAAELTKTAHHLVTN